MATYFLVNKQTNIVENAVAWDGNTATWQPPETHFTLLAETTPASDWVWDEATQEWVEVASVGNGSIGDSWDGTRLIEPKPTQPPEQPMPETPAEII